MKSPFMEKNKTIPKIDRRHIHSDDHHFFISTVECSSKESIVNANFSRMIGLSKVVRLLKIWRPMKLSENWVYSRKKKTKCKDEFCEKSVSFVFPMSDNWGDFYIHHGVMAFLCGYKISVDDSVSR